MAGLIKDGERCGILREDDKAYAIKYQIITV